MQSGVGDGEIASGPMDRVKKLFCDGSRGFPNGEGKNNDEKNIIRDSESRRRNKVPE